MILSRACLLVHRRVSHPYRTQLPALYHVVGTSRIFLDGLRSPWAVFLTFMSPYLCPVRKRLDANRYVDSRPFSVTGDVEVQSTDAFAPLFSPFNCCSASRHDVTKIWYRLLWRLFSNLTNLAYHFVCGLALPNVPVFAAPGIGDPIRVPVVCS